MPGIKELKTRIKSVSGTRKITRAMQMVSAAKMRKAQNAVLASRTYSDIAWEMALELVAKTRHKHPLMEEYQNAQNVGVLILGSNRTLVGSLNSNLGSTLKNLLGKDGAENNQENQGLAVYGNQAKKVAIRSGATIVADFPKSEKTLHPEEIYPLVRYVAESYASGRYKAFYIVYNHFVSTLSQKPTAKRLLPIVAGKPSEGNEAWGEKPPKDADKEVGEYIFEPGPSEVLESLLPRIIESQIYRAILESNASEHSARMVMMKNATESAGDLIADYTLTYNQLRQNKITTELAEITAGRIALE